MVKDPLLCKIAKRNMKNVVPLYYEMKKAESTYLDSDSLFEGLRLAYTGGNIGIYSNNISKIWNNDKIGDEELKSIKWLCGENNFVIDYAKTLYKPVRPKEVDNIIKSYTNKKLPYFFKYAKDKTNEQVSTWSETPVNLLDKIIPSTRIRFNKSIMPMSVEVLLSNSDYEYKNEYNVITELYDYYNIHKKSLYNHIDDKHKNEKDLYVYQEIRKKILDLPYSKDIIVDTLVFYLYTSRKQSVKKTLWSCFGEEIYENIKKNIDKDSTICPICGKRVFPKNQTYCSSDCRKIGRKEYLKNKKNS